MNASPSTPDQWLAQFGLSGWRTGQKAVIDAVLRGANALCIMPTGGGKSLCYQLPSIARDGLTIVVSPLIALMKDQVDALQQLNIPATLINSSVSQDEQRQRIIGMQQGDYKLVYIAPERLRSSSFMRAVQSLQINLLAVDEAHCISQWGHDFRPDYARLGRFRERIGNPQTIALTATATSLVQEDICVVLGIQGAETFVSGFARDNLSLGVESASSNSERDRRLVEFLESNSGAGIIYASTRKNCEHVVELLHDQIDRPIAFYHAGLTPERRRQVQDEFMSGRVPIVVATNAFGMGIDKADLRFVVHYNLPGSIEAYYQEAGRAGRDGELSQCLLFYSYQDRFIQQFFIENSYPSRAVVKQVYEYLQSVPADPIEMTLLEVKDELGLSIGTEAISTCENLLEKAGALERLDSKQNMAAIKISSELPTLVDLLPRESKVQRRVLQALEKRVGTLRGERIYFIPKQLAADLDMKWEAVSRAIRQIANLDAVDYVPPFRGRALHLLCRGKRFEQLEIDFAELERRRQAEFQKLDLMIGLATTPHCRQLEILTYFGDPDQRNCGRCDNCQRSAHRKSGTNAGNAGIDVDACLYAVQVALSGAARTHGRIGKTLIAQMLTGSSSKKVKGLALHRLSTFGLLQPLSQSVAVELLDWLIDNGFLAALETIKYRPVIQLSETGKSLMAGQLSIECLDRMQYELKLALSNGLKGKTPRLADGLEPSSAAPRTKVPLSQPASKPIPVIEKDAELKSTLKTDVAHGLLTSTGPVAQPKNTTAVGSATTKSQGTVVKRRVDLPEPGTVAPSWYWTWKLFSDGFSPEQVQQVRQIDPRTVSEHLVQAAENRLKSKKSWLLSDEQIEILENLVDQNRGADNATLVSRLPKTLSAQQLFFFLNAGG